MKSSWDIFSFLSSNRKRIIYCLGLKLWRSNDFNIDANSVVFINFCCPNICLKSELLNMYPFYCFLTTSYNFYKLILPFWIISSLEFDNNAAIVAASNWLSRDSNEDSKLILKLRVINLFIFYLKWSSLFFLY